MSKSSPATKSQSTDCDSDDGNRHNDDSNYVESSQKSLDANLWKYVVANSSEVVQLFNQTPAPTADDPTFMVVNLDIEGQSTQNLCVQLERRGIIESVERTRIPEHGRDHGTYPQMKYEWNRRHYKQISEYIEGMTTFPDCPHRVHIYNPRDSDDEMLACKHCGTAYSQSVVKELL